MHLVEEFLKCSRNAKIQLAGQSNSLFTNMYVMFIAVIAERIADYGFFPARPKNMRKLNSPDSQIPYLQTCT